jgi:hypothetical protein
LELCPHHALQLQNRKQRHHDKSAAELLGDLTDFSSPEAINFLLGNLVRQLARKRIHRRDAMAIAYVCQLLLGSISSMDRHEAAQRTSADLDDIPPRLVFEPPDGFDPTTTPISDTLRLAASLTPTSPPASENKEGRA